MSRVQRVVATCALIAATGFAAIACGSKELTGTASPPTTTAAAAPSANGYTDSDGGTYEGVRTAFNELGTFEDIIQAGAAQAQGAAVAMLFGESANPWRPFGGTAGAG